jgi:hypothetical protein
LLDTSGGSLSLDRSDYEAFTSAPSREGIAWSSNRPCLAP